MDNMIYGDDPRKINGRPGDLANPASEELYTYVPSIEAIRQSSNLYVYCMDNPILYVDKDGKLGILATMLIGATLGALINGAVELGSQLLGGKSLSEVEWGKVGIQAAAGAAAGALAGSGVGLIGQVVGNAAISGVSNAATQIVYTGDIDFTEVFISAGIGALAGWAGGPGVFHNAKKVYVECIMEGSHLLRRSVYEYISPRVARMAGSELKKALLKSSVVTYTLDWVSDKVFQLIVEEKQA